MTEHPHHLHLPHPHLPHRTPAAPSDGDAADGRSAAASDGRTADGRSVADDRSAADDVADAEESAAFDLDTDLGQPHTRPDVPAFDAARDVAFGTDVEE
ncbi:hypothetical protein [Kribbella sp. NPDC051770]|uniref:hypothetical protein n=1 Tax=Kribbella sp. NPDC051770 TaxID=3155413 RepID=UPI0034480818